MPDIAMQVDIAADRRTVENALSTAAGINGWWTDQAEVSDGMLKPSFDAAPLPFDLKVGKDSSASVIWRAQSFPPHWVGTEIRWELSDSDGAPTGQANAAGTRVLFIHDGFQPGDPDMPSAAYTWGQCLGRLKAYAESGASQPYFVSG